MASSGFLSKDVIICEDCGRFEAHMMCETCCVHICHICLEKHIDDGPSVHKIDFCKCDGHEHRENKYICKDCQKLICSLCLFSNQHRDHHVVPIRDSSSMILAGFEQRSSLHKANIKPNERMSLPYLRTAFGETSGTKKTHEHLTWSEPIKSDKHKALFSSFKVDFPKDPFSDSFAGIILGKDLVNLETEINLLSNGIVLTKLIEGTHTEHTRVFEVKVVCKEDQLSILLEQNCSQKFFDLNEDDVTRVILINSESLPIAEAKLIVYRKYKHFIKKKKVFVQHVFEDFDEVAKLKAFDQLSSFCVFIEALINSLTIDLHSAFIKYTDKHITSDKIRGLCSEVFSRTKYEAPPSGTRYRDLSQEIAYCINEKYFVKGVFSDPVQKLKRIFHKTVEDLSVILSVLEEFQSKLLPEDQDKLFAELCKRDVIRDTTKLQKHPSIVKFIAGRRCDGKPVVKVYLRNDDQKAKKLFKKCSNISEDTDLEFVNVEKISKLISKKVEKVNLHEKKASPFNKLTLAKLRQIVQENGDQIYARYSNVVGIGISPVRCDGDKIQEQPCIVLYCLDKTIIPFGEKPLPKSLEGWHCDSREDLVMFGTCPIHCPSSRRNFPEPGCSIGIPSVDSAGSVGFLVESTNPLSRLNCGFLTASHVAIERFEELYHHGSLLSRDHLLALKDHFIVHPSWQDNGHTDHTVGEVVESFCGNYGLKKIGMDFALVKNIFYRNEEKEILPVANDLCLTFDGTMKVIKTGRTTGTTVGDLKHSVLSVKVDKSFLSRGFFAFFNCYSIGNAGNEIFFREGDSGSGVFVIENDGKLKPLGIAFAYMNSQTAVCRIDEIVNKLDLKIVKYCTSPAFNVPEDENSTSMDHNKNSCSLS